MKESKTYHAKRYRPRKPTMATALCQLLIRDLANSERARNSLETIRNYGWLQDGSIHNMDMTMADLNSANLDNSSLKGVKLRYADLRRVNLAKTNLADANLWNADLERAHLHETNFTGARLYGANLRQTNLTGANLSGSNLHNADLTGARLVNTVFDRETVLPDGNNWTPNVNLDRFTDPTHPQYWHEVADTEDILG